MKNYLTAEKAYEIASKWQENEVSNYVETVVDKVEKWAKKGNFYVYVDYPPTNVNRDSCIKALEELGYIIAKSCGGWTVHWEK